MQKRPVIIYLTRDKDWKHSSEMSDLFPDLLALVLVEIVVVLGVWVSLRPPRRERHLWVLGLFVLVGLASVGVFFWQQSRARMARREYEKGQEALQAQI